MLLNTPKDILRAFSEGHIGWREAARKLNVEYFSDIETMMKEFGFPLYQGDPEASAARMDELDDLLYDEGEIYRPEDSK